VVAGAFDVNGNPTTSAVETVSALSDLILGNGSSQKSVFRRKQDFSLSTERDVITTVNVDTGAWTDIEQQINANSQVFLNVHVRNLGAMTGILCRLDFRDPDHPEFWIPSKEGINREASEASHTWTITATGNYVLASRLEHSHFRFFRARFQAQGASADADTDVVVSWYHNGKTSPVEYAVNDPDAPN
jgi:hypothetical protein